VPDDVRIHVTQGREKLFPSGGQIRSGGDSQENSRLELLVVDWTFGTEELSTYSKYLRQVEKEPCLFMSSKDASMLGLKDGERVMLPLDRGQLEMKLRIVDSMAPGVIVMPKHQQLTWQKIEKWPMKVAMSQIRNVS